MKTWTHWVFAAAAVAGLFALSYTYSRRHGDELVAAAQVAELERIPVLDED